MTAGTERDVAEALRHRAAVVNQVRQVLEKTGHQVTTPGDVDRDVDRAIDLERVRREDALYAVALMLGHSRDYAATMGLRQLLSAVRDAALDRDRCSSCPWEGVAVECGGARGVCPGNTRPDVDELIAMVRHDGPGTLTERWAA